MSNQQEIFQAHRGKPQKASLTFNPEKTYLPLSEAKERAYDFTVEELFSEAWALTKGFKMDFFLGFLLYSVIASVVMMGTVMLLGVIFFSVIVTYAGGLDSASLMDLEYALAYDPTLIGIIILLYLIYLVVVMMVSFPMNVLSMGLIVMGQKRANGSKVDVVGDLFSPFKIFWKLFLIQLIIAILYIIGFFLLILPGIYILVASFLTLFVAFAYPNSSIFEVIGASWKMVNKRFFKILGVLVLLGIINFIAMIPFGIGLIWTMPLSYLVLSVLFKRIVEVSAESSEFSIAGSIESF